jgi:hypothetical protein
VSQAQTMVRFGPQDSHDPFINPKGINMDDKITKNYEDQLKNFRNAWELAIDFRAMKRRLASISYEGWLALKKAAEESEITNG